MQENRLGFVGAGSMAEALIRGVLTTGQWQPAQLSICNRHNAARLAAIAERWNIAPCADGQAVAARSDTLVLAVKPKDVGAAMRELVPALRSGQTVISVVAGVPLSWLEAQVPPGVGVVRAMPNTSCRVGAGATALAAGASADARAMQIATTLFSAVGEVVHVQEQYLDAVTGLSGTGPAYVYLLLEAMISAGEQAGLEQSVAQRLAVQTVVGAAKMVLETGETPATLREQVCSPGGTTLAALGVLQERGFVPAVHAAVQRATERSREMGVEVVRQCAVT